MDATNHYRETQCFNTVTHYSSGAGVAGKSTQYFTYKNDHFFYRTFDLDCSGNQSDPSYIQLDSIQLLLPTKLQTYCLEKHKTNSTVCKISSQCECCENLDQICSVETEDMTEYRRLCDGQTSCSITVSSAFLEVCPGREYECHNERCHSRWAEVTYSCGGKAEKGLY